MEIILLHHTTVSWLNYLSSSIFKHFHAILLSNFCFETVRVFLKEPSPGTLLGSCTPRTTSPGAVLTATGAVQRGKSHSKPQFLPAVRSWCDAARRCGHGKGSRILAGQAVLGSRALRSSRFVSARKATRSSGRALLIKAARGSRGISAPACSCIFKTWLCSSHRGKVQRGRTLFNTSKTRSFKIHFQTVAR